MDWLSSLGSAAQESKGASGGGLNQIVFMVMMMGVAFYLMILRPQKREQATRRKMLDNLKKGDKIVSIGGIHGWVTDLDKGGKTVSIRVDTKTEMKLNRSAVSAVEHADSDGDSGSADLKSQK